MTDTKRAVISELQQLIRLNVFKFHGPNLLTPTNAKLVYPPRHSYVKPKYFPNGLFNEIKAKQVPGGHRQKRYLYTENDTSSPTISLVGLFVIATIAATVHKRFNKVRLLKDNSIFKVLVYKYRSHIIRHSAAPDFTLTPGY